ncbi:MAG: SGNH/GDSL hydrolase family protein [Brasilonema sp.]
MRKELLTAGFVFLSLTSPLKASASEFSQFFIFGDSLSDTGNVFNATGGSLNPTQAIPSDPPFFQGRFSNNKIWVDFVGEELGLSPTLSTNLSTTNPTQGINYAIGGSNSGQDNAFVSTLPGVQEQVDLYKQTLLTNNQKADPNALYAVWGGANDYLFGNVTDVNQTVSNLSNAVESLAQSGAKNILVFNLPDLGTAPLVSQTGNASTLTTLTNNHNAALTTALTQLSNISGVNIITVDINSLFNRVLANPSEFGFNNVTTPCVIGDTINGNIVSVCDNPDDFVFFDSVHPTSGVHKLVAETALTALRAKSVPESSTVLALLAFAALGAAAILKHRQKQSALIPVASQIFSKQLSRTAILK